jgi:hypothetical protein
MTHNLGFEAPRREKSLSLRSEWGTSMAEGETHCIVFGKYTMIIMAYNPKDVAFFRNVT